MFNIFLEYEVNNAVEPRFIRLREIYFKKEEFKKDLIVK